MKLKIFYEVKNYEDMLKIFMTCPRKTQTMKLSIIIKPIERRYADNTWVLQ